MSMPKPMLGASLLASAASLPSNLMPLIVAFTSAEVRLPIGQVGFLATAYMLGQFTIVFGLPFLGFTAIGRGVAAVAAIIAFVSLVIGATLVGPIMLLPWLFIGFASGIFQYLATTTAAYSSNRRSAFAMRVGVAMLINCLVIAGFQTFNGFRALSQILGALGLATFLLASVGIALYARPSTKTLAQAYDQRGGWGWLVGLAIIFAFFLGQHGFIAFAIHQAQTKGIGLNGIAFAMAFCKGVAGTYLLGTMNSIKTQPTYRDLFLPGFLLASGVMVITFSNTGFSFLVGLLFWELSINVLSARTQSVVTGVNPVLVGRWLSAAILAGAAAGPAVNGVAIQYGHAWLFLAFACVSALLPFFWFYYKRHS